MKGKILIACFDRFRDEEECASLEAFLRLEEKPESGFAARLLSVSWEKNPEEIEEICREDWKALVFFGNGRGEEHKVEKLGLNAQGTNILDNLDRRCDGDLITKGGKAAYFATWDTERLVLELRCASVPCQLSYYPGLFLCNGSLYRALHHESAKEKKRPVALLHLSPERKIAEDLPAILRALRDSLAED